MHYHAPISRKSGKCLTFFYEGPLMRRKVSPNLTDGGDADLAAEFPLS
jgi:hypothetical protein